MAELLYTDGSLINVQKRKYTALAKAASGEDKTDLNNYAAELREKENMLQKYGDMSKNCYSTISRQLTIKQAINDELRMMRGIM